MSRSGKFIPGGRKDKDKSKTSKSDNVDSVQAEGEGGEGAAATDDKPGSRRVFKGARFSKPIEKTQRPMVLIVSIGLIVALSLGWYFFGILPEQEKARQAQEAAQRAIQEKADLEKRMEEERKAREAEAAAARAKVIIVTQPPGASATLGNVTKSTPATFEDIVPGTHTLTLTLEGYATVTRELNLEGKKTEDLGTIELSRKIGKLALATPHREVLFQLQGPSGFSQRGVLPLDLPSIPEGSYQLVVEHRGWRLPPMTIEITGNELTSRDVVFPYTILKIESTPPGAEVREGSRVLGLTPLTLSELRTGSKSLSIDKPGFKVGRTTVTLAEGQTVTENVTLEPAGSIMTSFGLEMMPVGGIYVGKTEVTQKMYQTVLGGNPSAFGGADRPVDSVSFDDAERFCAQATALERSRGTIPASYRFSLPDVNQWSRYAADADIDLGATSRGRARSLDGTMPVKASEPNRYGLYDIIGNVSEWTRDVFGSNKDYRTTVGGHWLSSTENFSSMGVRAGVRKDKGDKFTGFRVILTRE
jgi:hypothetical protein